MLSALPHIPRTCEFDYRLEAGLSEMYQVYDDAVPETDFIAYDRHIRALIQADRFRDLDASPEEMAPFQ